MTTNDDNPIGLFQELPESVRAIFQGLYEDLVSLHGKWQFYLDLFNDPETVELLNAVAMGSFQMIEESLRSDMTMSICRLTDPAQSCGKDNLSVNVLVDKLRHIPELATLSQKFHDSCKPVRDYRNKRVGHNDLRAALKPRADPLPNVTRVDIEDILASGAKLINHVYHFYVNGELSFKPFGFGGGGKDLVHWLKDAWERDQEDRRRPSGGETPESS